MSEDRPKDASEVIQAAALEAIRAMRSFLDIAESVVREPGTAATVGKAFAEAAASAMRPHPAPQSHDSDDTDTHTDDEGQPGRVRRIHLSE